MEQWLPLFRHLVASPAPNAAAFCSDDCPSSPPPAAALLRLLLSPAPTLPASDPPAVLLQTLPPLLQSQALSFLSSSAARLDPLLRRALAARVLSAPPGVYGFWARRGARYLLDGLPEEGFRDVSEEEFHELPRWLKEAAAGARPVLPWLPLDRRSMMVRGAGGGGGDVDCAGAGLEPLVLEQDDDHSAMQEVRDVSPRPDPPLGDSVLRKAMALRKEIVMLESVLGAQLAAKGLQDLCVKSGNARAVLSCVQPWEADDDTVRVMLSNLELEGDAMDGKGPALVMCSCVLPKLLDLQRSASSVLLSAALDLCKRHPAGATEALLFPLVLRKEGLNAPQCDVLTRIVKDCMKSLHVTAFCHRILSGDQTEWTQVCMPQHRDNIGGDLVWTDSLFALFYNILNQDVYLTPSTIAKLVTVIDEMAIKFSRSLKFGNFLLCFVSKCWHECRVQRVLLERAAETTNTFLTRAILVKLRAEVHSQIVQR